jgi:hypothetical protein
MAADALRPRTYAASGWGDDVGEFEPVDVSPYFVNRQSWRRHNRMATMAPRRAATTSRRRPQSRRIARTVGSRGDPDPPEGSELNPSGRLVGFLAASVHLRAHLERRTAAARASL